MAPPATAARRSRKRPRNSIGSGTKQSTTKKPKPPPPPPASLVKLLKSNKSVLKYFQALQENLDYDVQKWKDRARGYQAELEECKVRVKALESNPSAANGQSVTASAAAALRDRSSATVPAPKVHNEFTAPRGTRNNDSNEFCLSFSSDDDGDDDDIGTNGDADGHEANMDEVDLQIEKESKAKRTEEANAGEGEPGPKQAGAKRKASNLAGSKQNNRPAGSIEDHMFQFSSDDDSDDDGADTGAGANHGRLDGTPHQPYDSCKSHHSSNRKRKLPAEPTALVDAGKGTETSKAENSLDRILQQRSVEALQRLGVALWKLEKMEIVAKPDADVNAASQHPANSTQQHTNQDSIQNTGHAEIDSNNGINDGNNAILHQPTHLWRPLPKLQLWGDMLRLLKDATRIKDIVCMENNDRAESEQRSNTHAASKGLVQRDQFRYFPFMSKDFFPCFWDAAQPKNARMPRHPTKQISDDIFHVISFLDTLKPPTASDQPTHIWELTLEMDQDVKDLEPPSIMEWAQAQSQPGRADHGCSHLAQELVSSLHGEIVHVWPSHDRASNASTQFDDFDKSGTATEDSIGNNGDTNGPESPSAQSKSDQDKDGPGSRLEVIPVKYAARLAALVERCILVHLVIKMYLQRGDYDQAARLVLEYISANATSFNPEDSTTTEDIPACCRRPPVMSFCILEAMLSPPMVSRGDDWFRATLTHNTPKSTSTSPPEATVRMLVLATETVAEINRVRQHHGNERVRVLACIELAALERLQHKLPWLFPAQERRPTSVLAKEIVSIASSTLHAVDSRQSDGMLSWTLQLAYILSGNLGWIQEVMESIFAESKDDVGDNKRMAALLACSNAIQQLHIRQMETYYRYTTNGDASITMANHLCPSSKQSIITRLSTFAIQMTQRKGPDESTARLGLLCWAAWCCASCSDGENLSRIVQHALSLDNAIAPANLASNRGWASTMALLMDRPTVRVINLERRKDRMALFMTQAMQEKVMVTRALADASGSSVDSVVPSVQAYAVDGRGSMVQAEMRMVNLIGSLSGLNALVRPQWRPNDLRAFDTNAPATDHEVRISPTEKACALSHLKSWQSAQACLEALLVETDSTKEHGEKEGSEARGSNAATADTTRLRRKIAGELGIGGYASGQATFFANEAMAPQPVCVILEDDAMMVDRFTDRLQELLRELPRDFHFCSLGYGRPKTAPIVPYSEQLGIPTSVWYLTGYVVSLEGARHLLSCLPIRGPVDSWIGLKMSANWDNMYGYKIGVGSSLAARSELKLPPRKELASFFRFRAFAALTPLCSQKLYASSAAAIDGQMSGGGRHRGQNWRKKDTDIAYSGNNKS